MGLKRILRNLALNYNKATELYRRVCNPSGKEWAEYLRRHGGLYHLGADCSILPAAKLIDPAQTWIGDRVCLGNCTLICHDGSIEMLYNLYGVRLDRVGPIVIEDDVFIGENVILLAGTSIGRGSIVGAGSVVRQKIPAGSVVCGNPARVVGRVDELIRFWEAESMMLPWADLIARRNSAFDPVMEPELRRRRQEFFFSGTHLRAIAPNTIRIDDRD